MGDFLKICLVSEFNVKSFAAQRCPFVRAIEHIYLQNREQEPITAESSSDFRRTKILFVQRL